jgi:lipopolysaccharide biosynthesis glycosyltransferase
LSGTSSSIRTKLWWNSHWVVLFQNCIIVYPEFSYVFQYTNTGIIISIQKWYSFININVKSVGGVLFCSQASPWINYYVNFRTKLWWNSHWMVLFQNCFRQLRPPTRMAATVQFRCYWKQLWSRWAITGSWEPLVVLTPVSLLLLIWR